MDFKKETWKVIKTYFKEDVVCIYDIMPYLMVSENNLSCKNHLKFALKIFVSLFTAYINEKLIINKVILKLLKKAPLGNIGTKLIKRKIRQPA